MYRTQRKAPRLAALLMSVFLIGYTTFALLNTFLIPQDVVAVTEQSVGTSSAAAQNTDDASEETAGTSQEPVVTDSSYEADGVHITIETTRVGDTTVYIADIVLDDAALLKTGLAENAFGRNLTAKTSEIASVNNAILAINGDYYGFRDTGYVMRNGQLYRSTSSDDDQEDLVIYEDGTMEIIREGDVTAEELQAAGAVQIFSFGPGLVENGAVTVSEGEEVDQSMTSNPRTAIGMIEEGHYVMVVSDGRTEESEGLSLYELAQVMESLGCEVAYNLDGGGSSTMWFNGEVINNPTSGRSIKERSVSDIVYIGY